MCWQLSMMSHSMSQLHALAVAHMEQFFYGLESASSDEDEHAVNDDEDSYSEGDYDFNEDMEEDDYEY